MTYNKVGVERRRPITNVPCYFLGFTNPPANYSSLKEHICLAAAG